MGITGESSDKPDWLQRVLIGRSPKRTLIRAAIWVGLLFLLSRYVLVPIRVEGISMLPTLSESQIGLVNRLAYLSHPPQRGDIVAVGMAGPHVFSHVMLCKRVIALPGETIAFHAGRVVINGQALDEPYLRGRPCNWERPPEEVGPNEYYVVGDNRTMDFELHKQGRADRGRILGKVIL